MKTRWGVGLLGLGMLAMTGCGGGGRGNESPPVSTPMNVSGSWRGTATSEQGGMVNIALGFVQQGNDLSGTYVCSTGSVTCVHATGQLSGVITGDALTVGLIFADGHDCGAFDGTASATSMRGRYTCTDPLGDDAGTWEATK